MSRPKNMTLQMIKAIIKENLDKLFIECSKIQVDIATNEDCNGYLKEFDKLWKYIIAKNCFNLIRDPLMFHLIFDLTINQIITTETFPTQFKVLGMYFLYFTQPILTPEEIEQLLLCYKEEEEKDVELFKNVNPKDVCGCPIKLASEQVNNLLNENSINLLVKRCLKKLVDEGAFCICELDPLTSLYHVEPDLNELGISATSTKVKQEIMDEAIEKIIKIQKEAEEKEKDLLVDLNKELLKVEMEEKGFYAKNCNQIKHKFIIENFTNQLTKKIKKSNQ